MYVPGCTWPVWEPPGDRYPQPSREPGTQQTPSQYLLNGLNGLKVILMTKRYLGVKSCMTAGNWSDIRERVKWRKWIITKVLSRAGRWWCFHGWDREFERRSWIRGLEGQHVQDQSYRTERSWGLNSGLLSSYSMNSFYNLHVYAEHSTWCRRDPITQIEGTP